MKYIGTKIVEAEPAIRMEGKVYTVHDAMPRLFANREDGYKVTYADGYESWSPRAVFEAAYRPFTAMSFGQAVELLKLGERVARKGWNGKGMFVVFQKGYPQGIPCNEQTAIAWGLNYGDLFKCEPYLQIKMVNGSHAMWVPSINDVLAEDWEIVE